jgi:regulation of enolase protein 1 (concanavalin A-like superfamily)
VAGAKQDVYFGTSFSAVDQATTTVDPSGVYKGRIDPNTYDAGLLALGQTYYWRVDKVNADASVIKSTVWSFSTEPLAYRVTAITPTASSSDVGAGPQNTINGSGLTNDLHSAANAAMWVSSRTGPQPTWIQYAFDQVYKLKEMRVWNYNVAFEVVLGFGFKDVTVEYSTDGTTWTVLKETQFAQAPGLDGYGSNTTVDFGGVPARFVRLTAKNNWGGLVPQFGLSEVRFYYTPVNPREPVPASGAAGLAVDTTLAWRAGREAGSHQVYFGTDPNAVRNGTAPVKSVTSTSFDPGPLEFGKTYYWKVAEVNEATTPKAWEGPVWSFSTSEFLVVDNFETYTDAEGSRIYEAWVDGWTNSTGSTVGYVQAPFAEQTIIRGGKQSMPLDYNNTKTPFYSEAERTFDTPQDWTANGADTFALYFRGNPSAFVESAGTITMSGGGTDIWNNADQFRFAFKRLSGNGTIVAKVESIVNTDPWAKVGVMIRENLDPGARFAAVYATPGNGVRYQARLLNAGAAVSDTSIATAEQMALKTPIWVKIEKVGNSLNCYYSTDGTKWTAMAWNPQTIAMSGSIYIGLCVSSHNVNAATTAQFSNIGATGGVTGLWEVQAIGVAQPANTAAPLYVAVQDSAGKVKVIPHPDPAATTLATWQQWRIPLSDMSGIKLTAVKKLIIGVGDRSSPKQDGAGIVFVDDIGVGHPVK